MRVANKTIYETVKFNLGNATDELNRANRVVASGKRINDISDDPVGLSRALAIRSALSGLEQASRNISFGKSWLTAAESALGRVQGLISDAKALCVQMSTSTTGQSERIAASRTVQNMIDEVVSLSNTELNGQYLFSGSRTGAPPFSRDGTYSGDHRPFTIKIGKDATVELGSDGDAVFGDIFRSLSDLKTALAANDLNAIQNGMSDMDANAEQIANKLSDVGARMNRLEIRGNILEELTINSRDALSRVEDADIAEAITDLRGKELAYKAALSSSSQVMELSLVDYIK